MKVLITRPRAQAADFAERLREAGLEPIFFPVIKIRPVENNTELDNAIKNIKTYDWIVFTSVNAVNYSPLPLEEGLGVRIAAVGPKTAEALRKKNIKPDFVPDEYVAESILAGLGDIKNKHILLPRAEIARKELPEAIVKAGGIAHEVIVYQTLPAEIDENGLNALKSGVDFITFTSASTVENFVAVMRQNNLDPLNLPNNPLFACIGPITEQAARAEGLSNLIVAKEYTTDGLIKEISKHVSMEKNYGSA
jgi:uroporphyrinogen-III synthase